MKTIPIVLVSALLTASIVHAAEHMEEADYMVVRNAFNNGLYELAGEKAEDFLNEYPHTRHLYDMHLVLGRCYYYQNNLTRATHEFEMVLDGQAQSEFEDDALYWIGDIHFKNGDFKKALEYYQRVIDDFPSSRYLGYACYSKGMSYYELGYLEDAVTSFREVVSRYPFDRISMESQFRIGECEYLLKRYGNARTEFAKFLKNFSVSERAADAYYMNGEASFYGAGCDEAIDSFKRAIAISPNARWVNIALYRMARAYYLKGDYKNSSRTFRDCVDKSGDSYLKALSLVGLSQSLQKLSDAKAAVEICGRVINDYPGSDAANEAYRMKISHLVDIKDYGSAEAVSSQAISAFQGSGRIDHFRYMLGGIYTALGKHGQAEREYEWLKDNSHDPELVSSSLCRLGDIRFDRNEYKEAMTCFDAVLDRYPESVCAGRAQYQIGNILFLSGKHEEAALAYKSVLVNFPDASDEDTRVDSYKKIGLVKKLEKDYDSAIAYFRKVQTGEDNDSNAHIQYEIAESLELKGSHEDAVREYLGISAAYPKGVFWSVRGMLKAALVYEKIGRPDEALRLYNKLAAMDVEESKFAKERLKILNKK